MDEQEKRVTTTGDEIYKILKKQKEKIIQVQKNAFEGEHFVCSFCLGYLMGFIHGRTWSILNNPTPKELNLILKIVPAMLIDESFSGMMIFHSEKRTHEDPKTQEFADKMYKGYMQAADVGAFESSEISVSFGKYEPKYWLCHVLNKEIPKPEYQPWSNLNE